jgi:hypothetical protein
MYITLGELAKQVGRDKSSLRKWCIKRGIEFERERQNPHGQEVLGLSEENADKVVEAFVEMEMNAHKELQKWFSQQKDLEGVQLITIYHKEKMSEPGVSDMVNQLVASPIMQGSVSIDEIREILGNPTSEAEQKAAKTAMDVLGIFSCDNHTRLRIFTPEELYQRLHS